MGWPVGSAARMAGPAGQQCWRAPQRGWSGGPAEPLEGRPGKLAGAPLLEF